jgi:hypothetical protein
MKLALRPSEVTLDVAMMMAHIPSSSEPFDLTTIDVLLFRRIQSLNATKGA